MHSHGQHHRLPQWFASAIHSFPRGRNHKIQQCPSKRKSVRNNRPPWNIGLQIGLHGFDVPAEFTNPEIDLRTASHLQNGYDAPSVAQGRSRAKFWRQIVYLSGNTHLAQRRAYREPTNAQSADRGARQRRPGGETLQSLSVDLSSALTIFQALLLRTVSEWMQVYEQSHIG